MTQPTVKKGYRQTPKPTKAEQAVKDRESSIGIVQGLVPGHDATFIVDTSAKLVSEGFVSPRVGLFPAADGLAPPLLAVPDKQGEGNLCARCCADTREQPWEAMQLTRGSGRLRVAFCVPCAEKTRADFKARTNPKATGAVP